MIGQLPSCSLSTCSQVVPRSAFFVDPKISYLVERGIAEFGDERRANSGIGPGIGHKNLDLKVRVKSVAGLRHWK
jgi:hypothetical protein